MLSLFAAAHIHLQTASESACEAPPLTVIGEGGLTMACVASADVQKAQGRGPNTRPGPPYSHAGHASIYLIIHHCMIHYLCTCTVQFMIELFISHQSVFTHAIILCHMSTAEL